MAALPASLDHQALRKDVFERVLRHSALPVWTKFDMGGFRYEVLWPEAREGMSGLRLRLPGDTSTQYAWSQRGGKWMKSRTPLEAETPTTSLKGLDADQREFYKQSPADLLDEIKSIPKSMLRSVVFIRELLPAPALAYLKTQGIEVPSALEQGYRLAQKVGVPPDMVARVASNFLARAARR